MTNEELQTKTKSFQLDIVSVEKSIFSGEAKSLVVTGKDGELGILPGHSPLLSIIKPGQIKFILTDNSEQYFYVSGGFIEVQPKIVTILADTVIRAEDIDEERAREAKEKAEKILARKRSEDYAAAIIELTKALAKLRIAEQWHRKK